MVDVKWVDEPGAFTSNGGIMRKQRTISRARSLGATAAVMAFATALVGIAPPASADTQLDPLAVVESQGLLKTTEPTLAPPLEARAGATPRGSQQKPQGSARDVLITPVSTDEARLDEDTHASVIVSENHGFVTGTGASGTNASFVVIQNSEAPQTYSFTVGGPDTTLELTDGEQVIVKDQVGTPINFLNEPWARDANGVELRTFYSVDGNVVTQHVDTAEAAFPVVADPTTGCGFGWCSVYFNREETKGIAAGGATAVGAVTAGCALVNRILGAACAVASGTVIAFAQGADANGNCVGIVAYGVAGTPLTSWNPFIENRGSANCPG